MKTHGAQFHITLERLVLSPFTPSINRPIPIHPVLPYPKREEIMKDYNCAYRYCNVGVVTSQLYFVSDCRANTHKVVSNCKYMFFV